jgi:hypothetical protein
MRLFFLLILLQGQCLFAQFSDSFSDGDFVANPEWIGASSWFIVDAGKQALRLNAPAEAGEASLFTASTSMEEAIWQFRFSLGFNPSSANYAKVYLAADATETSQLHRSFYLVLGSSDDNVSLWQLKNGQHELLIEGLAGRLNISAPEGEIRVTRHRGGELILETNVGEGWQEEGRVEGTEGFSSVWFGLSCRYTATRSALFWFADFLVEGEAYADTVPSRVEVCEVLDSRTVEIKFSREIISETFDVQSFFWQDSGPGIDSVAWLNPLTANIYLARDYPNGQVLQAGLQSVLGINGAPAEDVAFTLYFYKTQRNDLVFTEVMANPLPSLDLPGTQYLELYNRGEQPINVSGFKLDAGTKRAVLADYVLFPGDFLLMVPADQVDAWSFVENKIELPDWPSLPVTGTDLVLRDKFGDVISVLQYNREMGYEGYKRDGGWSLEVRDANNLSGDIFNWDYGIDIKGGTPGMKNSLSTDFTDILAPRIESVFLKSDSCLVLRMTEPMDPSFLSELDDSWFLPSGLSVRFCHLTEPFHSSLEICFASKIPESRRYEMGFGLIPTDLAGNPLKEINPVAFGRPLVAQPFDVVINELMYDPPEDGADFVELYNRSDKNIDLSELYLSRTNETGLPETLVPVSTERVTIFPGEYLVLTSDKDWLTKNYKVAEERSVLMMTRMPNYVNTGGTVVLSDKRALVIDSFTYSEAMHYQLLGATKGVSLERLDANAPTQHDSNWHSASADDNYATPGRKNSQSLNTSELKPDDFLFLNPEVFTPNQDGVDDLLLISYAFEKPGYNCSVTIYNRAGQPVRYLVNNELAGTSGFYSWDGLNEQNARCPTGIYVVLFKCFHPSGEVKEVKKVAVLSTKFGD